MKIFRFTKYLSLILVLSFPVNHLGHILRPTLNDSVGILQNNNSKHLNSRMYNPVPTIQPKTEDTKPSVITSSQVVVFTIVLFASAILLGLLFGYSITTSPVKECLLLYLVQEAMKIFFLINLTGYVAVITCFKGEDQVKLNHRSAQFVSYIYACLVGYQLIIMNAIALLKVSMAKDLVLDPPFLWKDHDDRVVFHRARLASAFAVILLISALYLSEGYTKLYFMFVGEEKSLSQLSLGAIIHIGVFAMLLLTYVTNIMRHQYYHYLGSNVNAIFPNGMNHLALLIPFLLILFVLSGAFLSIYKKGNIWMYILVYQIIITIITPLYILTLTPRLRLYSSKIILNLNTIRIDVCNDLKLKFCFLLLIHRVRRIEPII